MSQMMIRNEVPKDLYNFEAFIENEACGELASLV